MKRLIITLLVLVVGCHAQEPDFMTFYGQGQRLYFFQPDEPGYDRTAIVFFHGGGWTKGRPDQFYQHSKYLSQKGIVCIGVEYRLAINGLTPYDCVEDAKSAIRHIRRNAHYYGIDPHKIIAAGGSAGGHLALMAALANDFNVTSCRPDGIVSFNGVLNIDPINGWRNGGKIVGPTWKDLSPYHLLAPGMPPVLLLQGDKDWTTPVGNATDFHRDSIALGNECELVVYPDQSHGFFNYGDHYYLTMMELMWFLRRF